MWISLSGLYEEKGKKYKEKIGFDVVFLMKIVVFKTTF